MTQEAVARKKHPKTPFPLTRNDEKLFAAKNSCSKVRFAMAAEAFFTDEDCTVTGYIQQVDKFDIEILVDSENIWIKKAMIMGMKVL